MIVNKNLSPVLVSSFAALIFFIVTFITLGDYGPSWDETLHFRRGQAYLYYFLTGKTNYANLPKYNLQGTNGDPHLIPSPRRSFYQNDTHNGEWFLKKDIGHPPLNGILSAFLNFLFYQQLGILPDIFSYHLFNLLVSSILVFVVCFFAISTFGLFAGLISFLSLITYPLFFAEGHFNIKDPALAAFFAGTLWTFYQSLVTKKVKWLIGTTIFLGMALGTKFNVLFLPLIVVVYLIYLTLSKQISLSILKKFSLKHYLFLFFVPLGSFLIFLISWPYLLKNFPANLLNVLYYYKEIGIGANYQPENFYILGFNTFPLQWIIFTTPPLVLFLTTVGIFAVFKQRKRALGVTVLWLIWFVVPIIRVSLPNTAIYGGIRQILEFLPAMALLSGLGAWQISYWLRKYKFTKALLLLFFLFPLIILIKMHPNQNVYFNFLIGGLKGATERNFPSWGNSFGNAYLQGIKWINEHAEYGAKLALIQGTPSNAPLIFLRPDINYLVNGNEDTPYTYFSGIDKEGEYLMELTFNDTGKNFFYRWEYVEKFLDPVYELKVDGVSILKIWKNDLEHTKKDYKLNELLFSDRPNFSIENNNLIIGFKQPTDLSHISINFSSKPGCIETQNTFVETSLDSQTWYREKDSIPQLQIGHISNISQDSINYYFAGKWAKYVRFLFSDKNSCPLSKPNIVIYSLG